MAVSGDDRITYGRKLWKLSEMDLKSYARWDDYTRAHDEMFEKTHTPWAPWHVAKSDDKRRARLNVLTHFLNAIPYEKTLPYKELGRPTRSAWRRFAPAPPKTCHIADSKLMTAGKLRLVAPATPRKL
jgi:hypothetical protein